MLDINWDNVASQPNQSIKHLNKMTFVQTLIDTSNANIEYLEQFRNQQEMDRQRQIDTFFDNLTNQHLGYLMNCLKRASSMGKKEAFINFPRDDFRINIRNTGNPKWVCGMWLQRLTATGGPLEGIRYDVWGNAKFTTKFSW